MKKLLLVLILGCATIVVAAGGDTMKSGSATAKHGKAVRGMVSIDRIDGLYAPDSIYAGIPVRFYIRLTNATGKKVLASSIGFKIFSPDGVKWDTVTADRDDRMNSSLYDGGYFINYFSITGSGADTVGFGGFKIKGAGIPDGFDDIAYSVQIGPIDKSFSGKRVCIDSSYYPPGGAWLWSLTGEAFQPTWEGPFCYTVVNKKVPSDITSGTKGK